MVLSAIDQTRPADFSSAFTEGLTDHRTSLAFYQPAPAMAPQSAMIRSCDQKDMTWIFSLLPFLIFDPVIHRLKLLAVSVADGLWFASHDRRSTALQDMLSQLRTIIPIRKDWADLVSQLGLLPWGGHVPAHPCSGAASLIIIL